MKQLRISTEEKGKLLALKIAGTFDEEDMFSKFKIDTDKDLEIDVGGVDSINSLGCRNWIKWIGSLDKGNSFRFVNCSSVFVHFANIIQGFVPTKSAIESFFVPYYCETCDKLLFRRFESAKLKDKSESIPERIACDKCQKQAEVDVVLPVYLKFLNLNVSRK